MPVVEPRLPIRDDERSVEADLHDVPILVVAAGLSVRVEIAQGWPDVEHHLAQTWLAATGHAISSATLGCHFEAVSKIDDWMVDRRGNLESTLLHTVYGDLLLIPVSTGRCDETLRQRITDMMAGNTGIDVVRTAVRSLEQKDMPT